MSKLRSLKVIARVDDLAREIRHDYIIVKKLTEKARSSCNEAIAEAILFGSKLNEAKQLVGHGKWMEWLAKTCPEISIITAQRYIRLANSSHVMNLKNTKSLRQAYLQTGIIGETDEEQENAPRRQLQNSTPEQSEFPPDQYTHVTGEPQPVIEATVVEVPPLEQSPEQAQQPEQQQQAQQSTTPEETPSTILKQKVKEFMAYLQSLDKAWKKKSAVHLKPIVIHYHRYHK